MQRRIALTSIMPTKHCSECNTDTPCGHGHLYVLELGLGIENCFPAKKPDKGFVYVGSTGKSVEERFRDNFTRKDGTVVSIEDARVIGEDGQWKWATPGVKRIRRYFVRFRPDLLYSDINPLPRRKADPDQLNRREGKLAKRLRNRGWEVFCDQLVDV